jgi:TPP-dependent pyruvate/acetoin dehydrogenase alpha subunit
MMNGHFATRFLNENGDWLTQTDKKNSSADISPTAGQMPRLLGLAYASKLYRQNKDLADFNDYSINGNEVAFGTIGNASTSEGHFWETMNATGVLQVPVVMSIWDDDYGISVPQKYHTIKENISEALSGFQRTKDKPGFEIFVVKAWDYPALLETYRKATSLARKEHIPSIIHVQEVTQPQGHSTSGSHERYKPKDRLEWERAHDCILKMREWIESEGLASAEELDTIEKDAKKAAKEARSTAWKDFMDPIKKDLKEAIDLIEKAALSTPKAQEIKSITTTLSKELNPEKSHVLRGVKQSLRLLKDQKSAEKTTLINWLQEVEKKYAHEYMGFFRVKFFR